MTASLPRSRRSLLYVPGSDWRKVQKSATLAVDTVCLDLEDGVALTRKTVARQQVTKALQELDFGQSERLVRLNGLGSPYLCEDLDMTLTGQPDGYVVPKVEQANDLVWFSDYLDQAEQARGWAPGSIRILAIIETPAGVTHLADIATATPRLDALLFGAMDFSASLGLSHRYAPALLYARSAIVTHAAAQHLQALDMVCEAVWNRRALRREVADGVAMGFTGKQIIHPDHVAVTQHMFSPSAQAIAAAQNIVQTFQAHQQDGTGAYALNGKMIDMPVYKAALQVLAKAGVAAAPTPLDAGASAPLRSRAWWQRWGAPS